MSKSKGEEVISALWAICALLSFGFGFTVWGYVFAAKAETPIYGLAQTATPIQ